MDPINRILNDDNGFCFHLVKEGNNEDAEPFYDKQLLTVCDGLGGSGNSKHSLAEQMNFQAIKAVVLPEIGEGIEMDDYLRELFKPLVENTDEHTSALWGSRIAIARYTYAIKKGIRDEKEIRDFVIDGFKSAKEKLGFSIIKRDGVSMFSTTMASIVLNSESKSSVDIDVYWAGDSRCYCLSANGLQQLSDDHEDDGGMTNLFCIDSTINSYVSKRHYVIKKPCILFSCSDGFFDPASFACEVEEAFLDFISQSSSMYEFECIAKETYDRIKGDDCTIALRAFGFKKFDDIKKCFAKRSEYIKKYVESAHKFVEYAKYSESPEVANDSIEKMASRFETKKEALVLALSTNLNDPFVEPITTELNEKVQDEKVRMEAAIAEKKKKVINLLHSILRIKEDPIPIVDIFTGKVANVEESQKKLADSRVSFRIRNRLFIKMRELKGCISKLLNPYNQVVTSLDPTFRRKDKLEKNAREACKREGFNFGEIGLFDSPTKDYGIISIKDVEKYLDSPLLKLCFESTDKSNKLSFTKEDLLTDLKDAYKASTNAAEVNIALATYYRDIDALFNENKNSVDYLYSLLNKEKIATIPLLDEVYTLIQEIDNYKAGEVTNDDYKRAIAEVIKDGKSFLNYYDAFLEKYGLEKDTIVVTFFNASLIKTYKLIFDLKHNADKYESFAKEMTAYDENYYYYIRLEA